MIVQAELQGNLQGFFPRKQIAINKEKQSESKIWNSTFILRCRGESEDEEKEKSLGSEEREDIDKHYQMPFKRIRYLNPLLFYVTIDGHVFPTKSDTNISPLSLTNMSSRVTKVINDKTTGNRTYFLAPRFDSSDVVPTAFIIDKLKCGYDRFKRVAQGFESLMQVREELFNKLANSIQGKQDCFKLKPLTSIEFNDNVAQYAEVRKLNGKDDIECPVSSIVMNKKMIALLNMDKNKDGMLSLHKGFRNPFHYLSAEDSTETLIKYNEVNVINAREQLENSNSNEDRLVSIMDVPMTNNKTLKLRTTNKYQIYSDHIVNYYSFVVEGGSSTNPDLKAKGSKKITPAITTKTFSLPLQNEDKTSTEAVKGLKNNLEQAYEFCQKFCPSKMALFNGPPPERTCKIKELSHKNSKMEMEIVNPRA